MRYDRLAQLLSGGSQFSLDDMKRMQHDAFNAASARDIPLFTGWTASNPELERLRRYIEEMEGER